MSKIRGEHQYSDLLLALWILQSSFPLVYVHARKMTLGKSLLMSAVLAGTACLVKNEGSLWLLSYCVFAMVVLVWARRGVFAGTIAVAIASSIGSQRWLSQFSEIRNDLFNSDTMTIEFIRGKLLDFSRVSAIVEVFSELTFDLERWGAAPFFLFTLAIFSICRGGVRLRHAAVLMVPVVVQVVGYGAVYWLTPNDLVWHLTHSADRLLLQIYPLYCLLVFTVISGLSRKKALADANG